MGRQFTMTRRKKWYFCTSILTTNGESHTNRTFILRVLYVAPAFRRSVRCTNKGFEATTGKHRKQKGEEIGARPFGRLH